MSLDLAVVVAADVLFDPPAGICWTRPTSSQVVVLDAFALNCCGAVQRQHLPLACKRVDLKTGLIVVRTAIAVIATTNSNTIASPTKDYFFFPPTYLPPLPLLFLPPTRLLHLRAAVSGSCMFDDRVWEEVGITRAVEKLAILSCDVATARKSTQVEKCCR